MHTFHKSKSMHFTSQERKPRRKRKGLQEAEESTKHMKKWKSSKTAVINPKMTTQKAQRQAIQIGAGRQQAPGDQSINEVLFFLRYF